MHDIYLLAPVLCLQGNEDRQVWTPAYRYYEYIESTNFYRDAKALGKKRYVFAGLSAGAMTSQFAALDFKLAQVRGVYLFGLEKVGNTNFQVHYNFVLGDVTRAWWNRFDAWIEVPAANTAIADALPDDVPTFVNPIFQRLNNRRWWRIDPDAAQGSATACQRLTTNPELAAPCPGIPTASPACQGVLNTADHEPGEYIDNIRPCARASTADACVVDLAAITLPAK
jgi:pimeloyl-ACP methyl ester carboxylesterase